MRYVTLGFLYFFLLIPSIAKADNLPENLQASGKPETTLAGINLETTTLIDVIRLYGLPTREERTSRDPDWIGYIWELPQAKIELSFYNTGTGNIADIYVEGTTKGQIGSTGRGLKLGDDLNKLKRIYGNRFMLQTLRKDSSEKREEFTGVSVANKRVIIQWGLEGFTLTVGLDGNGKVTAMWLMMPCGE
jgi:hypothetical protein